MSGPSLDPSWALLWRRAVRFAPLWVALAVFLGNLGRGSSGAQGVALAFLAASVVLVLQKHRRVRLAVNQIADGDYRGAWDAISSVPVYPVKGTRVPIGEGSTGLRFSLDLRDGHVLIGGITGFGKSTLIRTIVDRCVGSTSCAEVTLIDLKRGVELASFSREPRVTRFAIERSDAVQALRGLREMVDARLDELRISGERDWVTAHGGGFIVVVVDEVAELLQNKEASDHCDYLVNRGRASGIVLVLATQQPTTDVIPSRIRQGCATRIAFRCAGPDQTRAVLGIVPDEPQCDPSRLGVGHAVVYRRGQYHQVAISRLS